jgi:hypothetical protein
MPVATDLRDLEKYTKTEDELNRILAAKEEPTLAAAAERLGIGYRTLQTMIYRVRQRRDNHESGAQPFDDTHVPIDQEVERISKMVRTDEGLPMWIKMKKDAQAERLRAEAIWESWSEKLPKAPAVQRRKAWSDVEMPDLLNMYLITDYHMGMKAFAPETRGSHWDIKIATNLMVEWFRVAIQDAPPAHTALFAQLGDFAHWDGILPVTPTSEHVLDADSRYEYMIGVCIRVFRQVIQMLLQKYQRVIVLHAEGNHDLASSVHFRQWSKVLYEDEPRVEVIADQDPYYMIRWGDVGLGFHHGHLVKMNRLDKVLAAKFRRDYGETRHIYAHMGHLHHDYAIETDLMTIEQHQTLAAADAYASRHGYSSARSAKRITYHQQYGEQERRILRPDEVYA